MSSLSLWNDEALVWKPHLAIANVHVRALDPIEHGLNLVRSASEVDGNKNFDIFACAKIKTHRPTHDLIECARLAWQKLRTRRPGIASQIIDDQFHYHIADQYEVETWLQETFLVFDEPQDAESLIGLLKSPNRLNLFFLRQSNEIFFRGPHSQIDTKGFLPLLDELLLQISCTVPGESVPFPSGLEIANLPIVTTCSTDQRPPTPLNIGDAVEIQYKSTDFISGRITTTALKFTKLETRNIIYVSRQMGVSVTHFLHAAFILASIEGNERKRHGKHAALFPIDYRPYVSQESDRANLQTAMGLIQVPLRSLEEVAVILKESYRTALSQNLRSTTEEILRILTSGTSESRKISSIILSSFGNLDSQICGNFGDLELVDFWSVAAPAAPSIYASARTFLGELEFRLCFHSSFHDTESMKLLLHRFEILVSNCLNPSENA